MSGTEGGKGALGIPQAPQGARDSELIISLRPFLFIWEKVGSCGYTHITTQRHPTAYPQHREDSRDKGVLS